MDICMWVPWNQIQVECRSRADARPDDLCSQVLWQIACYLANCTPEIAMFRASILLRYIQYTEWMVCTWSLCCSVMLSNSVLSFYCESSILAFSLSTGGLLPFFTIGYSGIELGSDRNWFISLGVNTSLDFQFVRKKSSFYIKCNCGIHLFAFFKAWLLKTAPLSLSPSFI